MLIAPKRLKLDFKFGVLVLRDSNVNFTITE